MSGGKFSKVKVAARSFIKSREMLRKTKCDFAKPRGPRAKVPTQHRCPSPVMKYPYIAGKLIDNRAEQLLP